MGSNSYHYVGERLFRLVKSNDEFMREIKMKNVNKSRHTM